MARFFTCQPSVDGCFEGEESVFAINLDRVKTISFTLAKSRCIRADLQLDREVLVLRNDDARDLYAILR